MREEFAAGGLKRREFSVQRRIPLTTFDYWRRAHADKDRKEAKRPGLVRVQVAKIR